MNAAERKFQSKLIKELSKKYPKAIIAKIETGIQGFPDILILYKNKWATLECKRDQNASHRPNQDHYVKILNDWSFSSFIYPENKEEVLDALEQALRPRRNTRSLKRE